MPLFTAGQGGDIPQSLIDAKGDLLAGSGADALARLAVGTNGQVLTADSAQTTGIKWATPSAGGLTELASGSLSTGSGTLTLSSISQSYKDLRLIIRGMYPATNGAGTVFRLNNISTANYYFNELYSANTSTNPTVAGTSFCFEVSGISNASYTYAETIIDVLDYARSGGVAVRAQNSYKSSAGGGSTSTALFGFMEAAAAVTRLDYAVSSGNFAGGTYVLYGVA